MSRNRFKHTHSLQWATVLKWVILVGTLASLGMSYVMMKNQILRLASDVRDLEIEHNTWVKRNYQLEANINHQTSHAMLQQRVNELGLGMVKIAELNVVPMEKGTATNRTDGQVRYTPVAYNTTASTEKRP